jgi:hypothetical protein
MKRPSFNPAAFGDFFIRHGEKLLFGAIGLLAAVMIWWGVDTVRSQSVDRVRIPDEVATLARQAADNIDRQGPIPRNRIPEFAPLAPRVDPWRPQQVKIADPPSGGAVLNRPLFSELSKRTKPMVFPITDLEAVAGIAVLPDTRAVAAGQQPGQGLNVPAATPEPDDLGRPSRPTRGRGRPRDPNLEDGLFGGGPLAGPVADPDMPAVPLPPGKIKPFIVVTGLIPAARQQEEYANRFGSASFQDPRRDSPKWGDYIVERSRVVEGGNPRWERLKLVNVERRGGNEGRPGGRDIADPVAPDGSLPLASQTIPAGFLLQPDETEVGYAAALPERIDEPWGPLTVHPWFMPRLKEYLVGEARQKKAERDKAVETALADLLAKPRDFVGRELRLVNVALEANPERQRSLGLYRFGVQAAQGNQAARIGEIGLVGSVVFATSEILGGRLVFDMEEKSRLDCNLVLRVDLVGKTPVARILEIELLDADGTVAATRTETESGPIILENEAGVAAGWMPAGGGAAFEGPRTENRLFRFVDMTVQPGAAYRYRVKFALRNPNVRLAPQHVVDVAVTQGEFLVSEFSNETAVVRVPDPVRLLARTMSREAARKLKVKGDMVEVIVLGESNETGNFALRSVVTGPGGLADVDPGLNRIGDMRFYGEPLDTGRLLVGVRGQQEERAESRSPLPAEPLEMLFLKPDGSFEIAAAADSERLIKKYRSSLFKPGEDVPDDGKPDPRGRDAPGRGFP